MFPQIFGKYVLEREIAAGGMARVYLATLRGAEGFRKRLVVKQIRPELAADAAFVQRFVGEAKTAVELSHPNIVPVYELGVEQGVYYIAMEYCPGVTLADVIFETGPLEPDEGAYLGAEVCRALDYAHRRAGVVHRDVTPRNVLIDDEGAIRLIDFGIAAPVEPSSGRAREVFGSPGHMPPEQLRGEELGPPADVFAVGALLVEAWTGKAPFRRATPKASAEALRKPAPRVDVELPALAPLAGVVESCLALDAQRRPARAEELAKKLRDFLRNADGVAIARRLAERVRRVRSQQRGLLPDGRLSSRPPPPNDEPARGSGATPRAPETRPVPASQPVTKTFAAREELTQLTRRLSSAPPSDGASGRASRVPEKRARWTGELASSRTRRALTAGAGLLLAAAAGFTLSRRAPNTPARPSAATSSAPAPAALTPARADVGPLPAASAPSPEPSREPAAKTSGLPPSPRPASSVPPVLSGAPPAPSTPAALASGTLRLTADPPAVVTVEGNGIEQTLSTPVRGLGVRPGAYRVTFRNETYRAPVATRVVLEPGGERSVHADFRTPEPRISQR